MYLSGKGFLLVCKGVVKLPLPRIGVQEINKCPELVFNDALNDVNPQRRMKSALQL